MHIIDICNLFDRPLGLDVPELSLLLRQANRQQQFTVLPGLKETTVETTKHVKHHSKTITPLVTPLAPLNLFKTVLKGLDPHYKYLYIYIYIYIYTYVYVCVVFWS